MGGADAPLMAGEATSDKTVVRLKTRPQFLFVRSGESYRAKSMVVQARRRRLSSAAELQQNIQIGEGFTATKKIGNAVARNRAKRRLRAASAHLLPRFGLGGVDYVFIARQQTGTLAWTRLLDDMEKALLSLASTLNQPSTLNQQGPAQK